MIKKYRKITKIRKKVQCCNYMELEVMVVVVVVVAKMVKE